MKDFRLYNRLLGWLVMLISSFVYLSTIEPTTSLWDCGEFIASAYKLQVGHPPGAPLFMIVAKFFSLFAGNDVTKVAFMINSMSALASAFTIMFLFWTITHLALKLVDSDKLNTPKIVAVLGSGLVGALAYTFSDTFWFSAVEGEVYASSSLFTAVVFWVILKWENEAHEKHANRWLILIAYLIGLSIGVHLLNLLAIPAIVLVYYFKKYKPTPRGILVALSVSAILLLGIMYGIIPGIVKVASRFELFFVNSLNMPFNSGVVIYLILLVGIILTGIYYSHKEDFSIVKLAMITALSLMLMGIFWTRAGIIVNIIIAGFIGIVFRYVFEKKRDALNLLLVSCAVIILGYSSFAVIVIRSLANPPMDENNPETVFYLQSYLNREQYGDHPLIHGRYFNNLILTDIKISGAVYHKGENKYVKLHDKPKYVYSPEYNTIFPRMYSPESRHINQYLQWANINEGDVYLQKQDESGNLQYDQNGNPVYDRGRPNKKPKFSQNIRFFLSYQVAHMYFRYFLWNFSGRQNNEQSNAGPLYGNAITGLNFIDKHFIGDINNMPDEMKNHKSRNTYYMLPLILGLLGMFFHLNRHKKDFWVVMVLFILTGIAIVVYLNQPPLQPRERDYAYAGSFYAFAIWIGLGVMALIRMVDKQLKNSVLGVVITLGLLFLVPGIMAKENWDDHDRSGRYSARDIAANYLNSCAPNAILFTNGDNDTFPLWYAQEVEGIRRDVRVVNLMLLNMDWYIEQMTRKVYESDPLPITLKLEQYLGNKNDQVGIEASNDTAIYLSQIVTYIANDAEKTKKIIDNVKMNYSPFHNFIIPVDSSKVVNNGTVAKKDAHLIADKISGTFPKRKYGKSDFIVMDIIANNNWERPIYFVSERHDATFGLEDYFQLEGFAYRLVPIKSPRMSEEEPSGHINTDILYDNYMNKFKYGRMNADDVYLDNFHVHTFRVVMLRHRFYLLANTLIDEGKNEKAENVLDKIVELTPHEKIPYFHPMIYIAKAYYRIGAYKKGNAIFKKYNYIIDNHLKFFFAQDEKMQTYFNAEITQNMQLLRMISQSVKGHGQSNVEEDIVQTLDNLTTHELEKIFPLEYYLQFVVIPYYSLRAFDKGNEKCQLLLAYANSYLSNPAAFTGPRQQTGQMINMVLEIARESQNYGQLKIKAQANEILTTILNESDSYITNYTSNPMALNDANQQQQVGYRLNIIFEIARRARALGNIELATRAQEIFDRQKKVLGIS